MISEELTDHLARLLTPAAAAIVAQLMNISAKDKAGAPIAASNA